MAVCLNCHADMSQTQAKCLSCGHDYLEPEETWRELLTRKSTLQDLFVLVTVLGVPLAVASHFGPSLGADGPHRMVDGIFAFVLGVSFYFCGWALSDAAPLWAKMFNAVGIVALLIWPWLLF